MTGRLVQTPAFWGRCFKRPGFADDYSPAVENGSWQFAIDCPSAGNADLDQANPDPAIAERLT